MCLTPPIHIPGKCPSPSQPIDWAELVREVLDRDGIAQAMLRERNDLQLIDRSPAAREDA